MAIFLKTSKIYKSDLIGSCRFFVNIHGFIAWIFTLLNHDINRHGTNMDQNSLALIEECKRQSIELLKENLTIHGIIAAGVTRSNKNRNYHCIFGRDAGISTLGMVISQDPVLLAGACNSLRTLALHQASNGQIPKYVDPSNLVGDFWYLGCIDATLWWLLAVDFISARTHINLRAEFSSQIEKAILWLHCQEHPRLYLLQQNEASDWADIMPRSGFVLYTNALWYQVKKVFALPNKEKTHYHFNHLFHPFDANLPDYRRLRLLMHYVRQETSYHELYLSFVNFSYFGKEGDVFGNLLAILFRLASTTRANRISKLLQKMKIDQPIPIRVTLSPIQKNDVLWRTYMERHRQNLEYRYHNSGSWPFVGGFWVIALSQFGRKKEAIEALHELAKTNQLNDWQFNEWFNGKTGEPKGMPRQSWNAAMFLLAEYSLSNKIY